MLRRLKNALFNKHQACLSIALRDMFGEYEHREELEELIFDLSAAGQSNGPVSDIIPEYIPDAICFKGMSWDFSFMQEYVTTKIVVPMQDRTYLLAPGSKMIVSYKYLDKDSGHAECILVASLGTYINMYSRGIIELYPFIFDARATEVIDGLW